MHFTIVFVRHQKAYLQQAQSLTALLIRIFVY